MFGLSLVKIAGESMFPYLCDGEFALFMRRKNYKKNEIVLVDHPRYGRIVKTVASISGNKVSLRGENNASTSQEQLGTVSLADIKGRLIWQSMKNTGRKICVNKRVD